MTAAGGTVVSEYISVEVSEATLDADVVAPDSGDRIPDVLDSADDGELSCPKSKYLFCSLWILLSIAPS